MQQSPILYHKFLYTLILLGKSALQILPIVITLVSLCVTYCHHPCLTVCYLLSSPLSHCVLPMRINVCFQVEKNSGKKISYMESNISSRMAQFPFFSYLTFIFKVKVLAFIRFVNIS